MRRMITLAIMWSFLLQITAATAGAYTLGSQVGDMRQAAARSGGTSCPQLTRFDVSTPGTINRQWSTSLANSPVTILTADQTSSGQFNEIETVVNTTYKDRVRLIWKNFPLNVHPWAEQGAVAAECAREQNPAAFWPFARDLYRDQTEITPQNLRAHIDSYITSLNLDPKGMDACILGKTAEDRVQQDIKDAQAIHVSSTPTFIVNGIPVVGLPTGDVFDFVITAQLQDRHASM